MVERRRHGRSRQILHAPYRIHRDQATHDHGELVCGRYPGSSELRRPRLRVTVIFARRKLVRYDGQHAELPRNSNHRLGLRGAASPPAGIRPNVAARAGGFSVHDGVDLATFEFIIERYVVARDRLTRRLLAAAGMALAAIAVFAASWASAGQPSGNSPCPAALRDRLKGGTDVVLEACIATSRLVPSRSVVLAVWSSSPYSPRDTHFISVLDLHALERGRRVYLYDETAHAESIQPIRFKGRVVTTAIADFDHSGRLGFALAVIPDADYSLRITTYNPTSGKFESMRDILVGNEVATGKALVDISPGEVLVPYCGEAVSNGKPVPHRALFYKVYRLTGGRYSTRSDILATAAPERERKWCRNQQP